jgi:hypothetical protein
VSRARVRTGGSIATLDDRGRRLRAGDGGHGLRPGEGGGVGATGALEELHAARPDLLGAVRVWLPDGAFVEAAHFTSEEDAPSR